MYRYIDTFIFMVFSKYHLFSIFLLFYYEKKERYESPHIKPLTAHNFCREPQKKKQIMGCQDRAVHK